MRATRVDFCRPVLLLDGSNHDTTIRDGASIDERARVVRVGQRRYPFEVVNFYDVEAAERGLECECGAKFSHLRGLKSHQRAKHGGAQ